MSTPSSQHQPKDKTAMAFEEKTLPLGRVRFWAMRGLSLPDTGTLFIADPHFGKAAAFRGFGIPTPDTTAMDLDRLNRLIQASEARHLVILGDFFHARSGKTAEVTSRLLEWRAGCASLEITLVRGNHDRGAGDPTKELGMECVDEPWRCGDVWACHVPQERDDGMVLAGHVHPGVAIRSKGGGRVRCACFCVNARRILLPAFGSFTGMEMMDPEQEDMCVMVGEGEVICYTRREKGRDGEEKRESPYH